MFQRSWICWFKILLMLYLLFEVSAFFRLPTRLLRYKKTRTTTAATTTTTTAKPKIRPHGFHHFHHHFGPRPYPDYFHRPPYTFYRYNGNQGRYTKPAPTTTTTTTTTAKPKGYSAHDHHFHYYPIPATPFYGGRNFFNPRRYNYDNRHGYQGHYGYKLPYFDNNSGLRRYKSTTTTTEAPPTTTEAPTTTTTKAPYVVPYNIYGDFAGYRQLQIQPYPYVYQPSSSKVTTTKVRAPKNYNVHVISSEAPNSRTSVAKHLPQRSDPRTFGTGTRLLYGSLGHPAIIIDQDSDLYDEIFWLVSDAYSSTSNSDGETSTTEASEPATTNVSNMETMANSTMKMAAITKAMRMPSEVTTMAAEEQMETRTGAAVATQSTSQPVTTEGIGFMK